MIFTRIVPKMRIVLEMFSYNGSHDISKTTGPIELNCLNLFSRCG